MNSEANGRLKPLKISKNCARGDGDRWPTCDAA